MPWCPICKTEYREGFNNCSDCNVALVPLFEDETAKEINIEEYDTEAFLISVSDNNHANVIESILQQFNIPIFKRYKESGGYLQIVWAKTPFGIDLYVPSKALEYAKDILEANGVDIEKLEGYFTEEDLGGEMDKEPYPILNNSNVFRYFIIAINLISILLLLILNYIR